MHEVENFGEVEYGGTQNELPNIPGTPAADVRIVRSGTMRLPGIARAIAFPRQLESYIAVGLKNPGYERWGDTRRGLLYVAGLKGGGKSGVREMIMDSKISSLAFDDEGRFLAVGHNEGVSLVDCSADKLCLVGHKPRKGLPVCAVALDTRKNLLAWGALDGHAQCDAIEGFGRSPTIWEARCSNCVDALAFDPRSGHALIGYRRFNPPRPEQPQPPDKMRRFLPGASEISFSQMGDELAYVDHDEGELNIVAASGRHQKFSLLAPQYTKKRLPEFSSVAMGHTTAPHAIVAVVNGGNLGRVHVLKTSMAPFALSDKVFTAAVGPSVLAIQLEMRREIELYTMGKA